MMFAISSVYFFISKWYIKIYKDLFLKTIYVGCPVSVRTLKIARHSVDLAERGKCYSLVMSLTNCVAKTALLYLA
jgi:hypothetical protein